MLKIAAVGNTYPHVKQFVEHKFRDKIASVNPSKMEYTLHNGDKIYLCYEEQNKERYLSTEFDAFVVAPQYVSLLDTIRYRSERG